MSWYDKKPQLARTVRLAMLIVFVAGSVWLASVAIDWSVFISTDFERDLATASQALSPYCESVGEETVSTGQTLSPFAVLWNVPLYNKWLREQSVSRIRSPSARAWQFRPSSKKENIDKVIPEEAGPERLAELRSVVCVVGGIEETFSKQACGASDGWVPKPEYQPRLVTWDVRIITVPAGEQVFSASFRPELPKCASPDVFYLPEAQLKAFLSSLAGVP